MLRVTLTALIPGICVVLSNYATAQVRIPGFKSDFASRGARIVINQVETSAFPTVTLSASVNRGGLPLGRLTPQNFRITEDDIDQSPLNVRIQRDDISVVVLIDVSGTIKGSIKDLKGAAISFLKTLQPRDRIGVIAFHTENKTIYPMGSDFAAAKKAILAINYQGDSALYDGIYDALNSIRDIPGQRAIVVLSDGVDDDGTGQQLSKRGLDAPLLLGIQSNIPVYTIGLGPNPDEGILKTLAGTTGGEYAYAPSESELAALYARMNQQLSSQYAIEYTSATPLKGGLREVMLDLVIAGRKYSNMPGLLVSYQAPNPSDKQPESGKNDIEDRIKPIRRFLAETSNKWPEEVPLYRKAGDIKVAREGNRDSFSFTSPEPPDNFIDSYKNVLKGDEWSVLTQSRGGSVASIKVSKGQAEMTVGVESRNGNSHVNIDYLIPSSKPLLVEKNSVNQIIAADGRDVIVTGTDGVIIISGGCGRLTIKGEKNQVQCDVVQNIEITGDKNVLILGSLGAGIISGSHNEIAWGIGIDGLDPDVKNTGSANKVMRLE